MKQQYSNSNIHAEIKSQHGREALQIMRKCENIGNKIASWHNHRAFNLRCSRYGVVPPSVRLSSNVHGVTAEKNHKKGRKEPP